MLCSAAKAGASSSIMQVIVKDLHSGIRVIFKSHFGCEVRQHVFGAEEKEFLLFFLFSRFFKCKSWVKIASL